MLAFFSVEDSEKRAASVDQLKNADSSILLKKNSLAQSLTDTEKYIPLNHHLTLGTDTFAQKKIHNKMFHFKHLGRESIPMALLQRVTRWGFLQILYVICNICRPQCAG